MALTEKKIVSNITKYIETATKYEFLTPELEKLLGENAALMSAPASTKLSLHNAFKGGLVDHILRVMKHAYHINKNNLPDTMKITDESLFKVVLLHQIGKVNLYVPQTNQWYIDKQGKTYEFNEELTSMRVGERSIFYALSSGVELTDEEFAAILHHDKVDDLQSEWYNTTLGDVLKISIRLAIMEEKDIAK